MDHTTIRQRLCQMQQDDVMLMRDKLFGNSPATTAGEKGTRRTRHSRKHIWPEIGVRLSAQYFGVHYSATIIPAQKKLKSGKQIRIDSGPAAGNVCDSFSDAMLKATHQQREDAQLRRKGVSNGWEFWSW